MIDKEYRAEQIAKEAAKRLDEVRAGSSKSELLPCPFCGGEAETLTADSMHGGYLFGIMCNDCRSRGDVYDNEAEAIAAWNTRAERTCSVVCIIDGLIMDEPNSIELSCGHTFETWDEVPPNYCPNCGAKVVGE